jgi:hypothetical protein
MIYVDKKNMQEDFEGRKFRETGESQKPDINFRPPDIESLPPKVKNLKAPNPKVEPPNTGLTLFGVHARDTLFRFDTIFSYKTKYDTVAFSQKQRPDTAISKRTTYKEMGRTVIAKEEVNIKVTERSNIFTQNKNRSNSAFEPGKTRKPSKKSKTILPGKYRSSFDHTPRVAEEHTYFGSLQIGASWFKPDIHFRARKDDYDSLIDLMNQNHKAENSYNLSFTYLYFKDKMGVESGLGISSQNYAFDYAFDQLVTDTSGYYDYFERQGYAYDTTWYLDLDYYLQTGDTLFIPNIDSTEIWLPDSTYKIRIDSTIQKRVIQHSYSFSFLEIPLIAHYTLVDKDFYARVSLGFVPMFMISKTGNFFYPESGLEADLNQISFDYGFMLSVHASASLAYKINDQWSFFMEPFVRTSLWSIIQNENIHLRTNSWGIKAGVAYRLFSVKLK